MCVDVMFCPQVNRDRPPQHVFHRNMFYRRTQNSQKMFWSTIHTMTRHCDIGPCDGSFIKMPENFEATEFDCDWILLICIWLVPLIAAKHQSKTERLNVSFTIAQLLKYILNYLCFVTCNSTLQIHYIRPLF